ncbi:MAG: metal ABC transporter substrate-binding protein [Verrucomicrobiota bacterium]
MKTIRVVFGIWMVAVAGLLAEVRVGSLHPLMADLVEQVGGERVEVVNIGRIGMDVHAFEPTARDVKELASCQLVVASGKGLERYLDALRDGLGEVPILEVGQTLPARTLSDGESLAVCCPNHAVGTIDPHWWHDVTIMERAVKVVERELIRLDPEGKSFYQERSRAYRAELEELDEWVKLELTQVPKTQRKLVTAHAAFGYFCAAYEFTPVFVLGLSGDHGVPAKRLAEEVQKMKDEGVKAVFPEMLINPKVLKQIAKEAGAEVGKPLVADGAVPSYVEMMRGNVASIVAALGS